MLLKDRKKNIIIREYFKNENEAIQSWARLPNSNEWEILHLEERTPKGHRYELTYSRFDKLGGLCSKYIICFSKKEALYLENKIKEANRQYITQIKEIY